jgi:hypothetical protein
MPFDFSAAHVHLLINHFPTIGFIVAAGLFFVALAAKSDHLKVGSLVVMVGIAILTIPVYASGSGAQAQICGPLEVPGPCETNEAMSRTLIEMHEAAAFIGMYAMFLTGGLAWLALWHYRRFKRIPAVLNGLIVVMAFVTMGLIANAANLGGEISHPEIRVTQEATEPPLSRVIGTYIATTPWTFASAETLHMIGLSLIIGVVLLIDLKVLGFLPAVPYATLDRMLPWGILGFGLNAMTGMLFFVAAPNQYVGNPSFNWKLVFLMAAGLNTLLFTFDETWMREERPAPAWSKTIAVSALVLWVTVMFFGTMLPFLGQAF